MSKNLLDNGTVLTLGLVGAVAAIGAAAKRGVYGSRATATQNVMERLRSQLNGQGFSFELEDDYLIVDDGASVSIVAVDSPLRPDAQGPYRPGVDDMVEPTMVEVAKRKLDRNGNLVSMRILGEFPVASVSEIAAAIRGGARGSRASTSGHGVSSDGRYYHVSLMRPQASTHMTGPWLVASIRGVPGSGFAMRVTKSAYDRVVENVRRKVGSDWNEAHKEMYEAFMAMPGEKRAYDAQWGIIEGVNEDIKRGSRAKRAETFSVGDKVKHKREFLRSIGWMTNVPRNGVVRSVTDGFSGRQLLEVAWSDGTTSKIISPNVTHAGKVELV